MGGGLSFVVRLAQATKGKASPLSRARGVTDRFSGRRRKRRDLRGRRGTAPQLWAQVEDLPRRSPLPQPVGRGRPAKPGRLTPPVPTSARPDPSPAAGPASPTRRPEPAAGAGASHRQAARTGARPGVRVGGRWRRVTGLLLPTGVVLGPPH